MALPVSRECLNIGGGMAGLTLILTFLAGLFGGVGFGLVLLRSLLFTVLLGLLGVGIGVVLERFIPGIWETDAGSSSDGDAQGAADHQSGSGLDYTIGDGDGYQGERAERVELPDAETGFSGAQAAPSRRSSRHGEVVGNYRIIDDKRFPEDPDTYAKAIRTMMHKDE
jgi:hypothetical protein